MWNLPGPQALLLALAADLEEGRSVELLIPARGAPRDLLSRLRDATVEQPWNSIELAELIRPGMTLEGALLHVLGADCEHASASIADLAAAPQMGRRVLAVDCELDASAENVAALGRVVSQYAAATRDRSTAERAVFAIRCRGSAAEGLPPSDTFVTRRWWWSVLNRIDTEAHLRLHGLDARLSHHDLVTVCELASFDLTTAETLAESWDGDAEALHELVAPIDPDEASATLQSVRQLEGDRTDRPPPGLLAAWDVGLVESWSDRSPCAHLACHVSIGDRQPVQNLIWRSQLATLMPMIELHRERLARWSEIRRAGINDSWSDIDVIELEIGPLHRLIRETPVLRRSTAHVQLAGWLKDSRDALAHRRALERTWIAQGRTLASRT